MDTFQELQTAVQSDLTVDSTSTLFNTTAIKLAINRAYRKAGALFPWPELQDAKKTSTVSGQNYYDYPQNWRSLSIWKLEIGGERYGETPDGSPLAYDDFLNWKEDNPTSTDKKWARQWRRFFISPTPTSNGTNDLCIWGQMVTTTLSADADVTIFSYSMPEGNEAIVLEAVAILKNKGSQEKAGEFRSLEAKQILASAWGVLRKEQAKYEQIKPMFEVPDLFGGNNSRDLRGRFDI